MPKNICLDEKKFYKTFSFIKIFINNKLLGKISNKNSGVCVVTIKNIIMKRVDSFEKKIQQIDLSKKRSKFIF